MTEEKLVERVTALFADSDAAQRKMIRHIVCPNYLIRCIKQQQAARG